MGDVVSSKSCWRCISASSNIPVVHRAIRSKGSNICVRDIFQREMNVCLESVQVSLCLPTSRMFARDNFRRTTWSNVLYYSAKTSIYNLPPWTGNLPGRKGRRAGVNGAVFYDGPRNCSFGLFFPLCHLCLVNNAVGNFNIYNGIRGRDFSIFATFFVRSVSMEPMLMWRERTETDHVHYQGIAFAILIFLCSGKSFVTTRNIVLTRAFKK